MSIVPLARVSIVGINRDQEQLLEDLYQFGCLEIIPAESAEATTLSADAADRPREALRFLLACPQRRHQSHDTARFDAIDVEAKSLQLQERLVDLQAERDDILQRLIAIRPFGEFNFSSIQEMGNWRCWFYVVPHRELKQLPSRSGSDLAGNAYVWEIVRKDNRNHYVVVFSQIEPTFMPFPRIDLGSQGPETLARRLEDVELAIEDVQAERAYLTRWCTLLARNFTALQDATARASALRQIHSNSGLFALEAWVPQEHLEELSSYAVQRGFVCHYRLPDAQDHPPTYLRNEQNMAVGEDLVSFYMTPGYWTWDPSPFVLVSFAIFFAMILADAGYAAVLGIALALAWKPLGRSAPGLDAGKDPSVQNAGKENASTTTGQRFRPLLLLMVIVSLKYVTLVMRADNRGEGGIMALLALALTSVSLIYGVLVGSYFGITPPSDSFLGRLQILDMANSRLMMGLSVVIGGLHLVLANLMDARRHVDVRDGLASLGWAVVISSGLLLGAGAMIPALSVLKIICMAGLFVGLLLVVGYTAWRARPLSRLLQGLLGLTKISAAFGDVLSYLRLFALGLASASLATAFNDMAEGINNGLPQIGLLLALLVLLFGHSLNLLLGVSSGVIHGLRLNVIEFFNWGLKDEGRKFAPFRRKEGSLWN